MKMGLKYVISLKKNSAGVVLIVLLILMWHCFIQKESTKLTEKETQLRKEEDYLKPLIFIGGQLRSGTTLMRTMLDAHPDIRCGPESLIIPSLLHTVEKVTDEHTEFMQANGLLISSPSSLNNVTILDTHVRDFIFGVIQSLNEKTTPYLCNKDPLNLLYLGYLERIFPRSKFIYMVRDPRAVVFSMVKILDQQYEANIPLYIKNLVNWNMVNEKMHSQCLASNRCTIQHYEQLVLQPVQETKKLFKFIDIPWNVEVLYHEKHINETKIAQKGFSEDQVVKPIYLDALTNWFGTVPLVVKRDLHIIAPMMTVLGYNPFDDRPNYGEPDDFVLKQGIWKNKD